MIIQNYVENAVKHGLKHKRANRKLWIKLKNEKEHLSIVVEDNGVGRKKAATKRGDSTGKGLKIMESMYKLYFNLYKIRITHQIDDLADNKGKATGTRVSIHIPMHKDNRLFYIIPE